MEADRVIVTGAAGFMGRHLVQRLQVTNSSLRLYGADLQPGAAAGIEWIRVDLTDKNELRRVIADVQPVLVFHLAGVVFSRDWETLFRSNVVTTVNLMESLRDEARSARVVITGSAAEYGHVPSVCLPIREDTVLRPTTPYGVAKAAQVMTAFIYRAQVDVIAARVFNVIGFGMSKRSSIGSFALQLTRILRGEQEPILRVGNLNSKRDFLDVRDVVDALARLAKYGQAGSIYNVCRGESISMRQVVDMMIEQCGVPVSVVVEQARLAASDVSDSYGDPTRIRADTGWQSRYTLRESLAYALGQ